MSSSIALLPKDRKKDDHPIFLRVCHSPWSFIGQKALAGLRGLTAAYLLVSFAMIIDYEIKNTEHKSLAFFEFPNISYFIQILYQIIAFTWTFMHLHYPHHSTHNKTFATSFQAFFSPPKQNPTTKNRVWFSIFYTAVNTFPWVTAFIHWAILVPLHKTSLPDNDFFSHGWFTIFIIIARFVISPFVTILEVFFFSSIKRQTPISAHIVGLAILIWHYFGWAFIGYIITDKYPYFFFDHKAIGWGYVTSSWAAFTAVAIFFFFVIYGITCTRERFTSKGDNKKKSGYQQLPH